MYSEHGILVMDAGYSYIYDDVIDIFANELSWREIGEWPLNQFVQLSEK